MESNWMPAGQKKPRELYEDVNVVLSLFLFCISHIYQ
jgi:hypothetical protein